MFLIIRHIGIGARVIPDPVMVSEGYAATENRMRKLIAADEDNLYTAVQVMGPQAADWRAFMRSYDTGG